MKHISVYTLLLMLVLQASCTGQNQPGLSKDIATSQTDTASFSWPKGIMVAKLRKGSSGTILIASDKGVFRYDGKSFTNLTRILAPHKYHDALEDRNGDLWLASDSGVYRLKGKALPTAQADFQHFTIRDGLANDSVLTILEDKTGNIWLGTQKGLSRYDGKSFRNFNMKGEQWWTNIITTITEDKTGRLWIGTRGDVSVYDGKSFTALTAKDDKVTDIWSIIEDKKGNIWLGGWDGLRSYDGKTFTKIAHNKLYNFVIQDSKGNIWTTGGINAATWALSRYDQNSLQDKNPNITQIMSAKTGTFSGLLEASDGSIWFGYGSGLYRYDGRKVHTF